MSSPVKEMLPPSKPPRTFSHFAESPVSRFSKKTEASENENEAFRHSTEHSKQPFRIPALQDSTNIDKSDVEVAEVRQSTKMNAVNLRSRIIDEFRQRVEGEESGSMFSGTTGMDALTVLVLNNNNYSISKKEAEEKALRCLDHWLLENIIREVDTRPDDEPLFVPNSKVFYKMNPVELHRVCPMTPASSTTNAVRERSSSSSRRPSRTGSLKRMLGLSKKEKEDLSTPKTLEIYDDVEQPRKSSSRRITLSRQNTLGSLADEAVLFEVALARLLLIVDCQFVDDVLSSKSNTTNYASFLSSLLKRVGISNDHHGKDEHLHSSLLNSEYLKNKPEALNWFKAGINVDHAQSFTLNSDISLHMQVYEWANQTLKAVVAKCSHWTDKGAHPLFPSEFSCLLRAICDQLCHSVEYEVKRDSAIKYLWLMIPSRMRHRLDVIFHFLSSSRGTDDAFSIREPYFFGKKYGGSGDNFLLCREQLKKLIFPKGFSAQEQNNLIEYVLQLTESGELGIVPEELEKELKQREVGQEKTPIRFCQAVEKSEEEQMGFMKELAEGIRKSTKFSANEKREKLSQLQELYGCSIDY